MLLSCTGALLMHGSLLLLIPALPAATSCDLSGMMTGPVRVDDRTRNGYPD